jgi:uncharacterized membrane protein YesL
MILFTIKKWFFDFWDNLLTIALLNLGFLGLLAVPLLAPASIMEQNPIIGLLVISFGLLAVFVYSGVAHILLNKIANYDKPEFRDIVPALKESWKSSLVFGLMNLFVVITLFFVVPFYWSMDSVLALAALVFLFWILLLWMLSSQYFFPIRTQLEKKFPKILKKSFIIFFDNGTFSFFIGIGVLVILALSSLTAFLAPGPMGAMLLVQVGLKLRLYKYDYLEENPEADRRKIPWSALIFDDKDRVGKRTIKGMIFPWKE